MAFNGSADEAAIEERRSKAWALRVNGRTYREIGEALSVSHVTAYNDIKAVMERTRSETNDTAEHHRELQLARLERLTAVLMPLAEDGSLEAIDRLDKLEKRRAALLGLDAPAKQEIAAAIGSVTPTDAARLVREAFGGNGNKGPSGDTGSGA